MVKDYKLGYGDDEDEYDDGEFQWSKNKARNNLERHHVSFEHARSVFDDPRHVNLPDTFRSYEEDRFKAIGRVEGKLYTVVYTIRDDKRRLISARVSEGREAYLRLDSETGLLVDEIVDVLPRRHPDVLAIILYGSVARYEERALDEPDPSDVDILVIVDAEDRRGIRAQEESLFRTLGSAKMHHLDAGRDVNVMFASRTAQEWDPTFIENVKRDGIILYQRVPLPAAFAS